MPRSFLVRKFPRRRYRRVLKWYDSEPARNVIFPEESAGVGPVTTGSPEQCESLGEVLLTPPLTPTDTAPVSAPVVSPLDQGQANHADGTQLQSVAVQSRETNSAVFKANLDPNDSSYSSNTSPSSLPSPAYNITDNDVTVKQKSLALMCRFCYGRFDSQRAYLKHMGDHNEEKPHICGFCGKGFQDKFDMKRHVRTHTGVRPFKCDFCPRAFTQRCSLETHVTNVHGMKVKFAFKERRKKLYVCEDCGHSVDEPYIHYYHMWTEHSRLEMPKRMLRKLIRKVGKDPGKDHGTKPVDDMTLRFCKLVNTHRKQLLS